MDGRSRELFCASRKIPPLWSCPPHYLLYRLLTYTYAILLSCLSAEVLRLRAAVCAPPAAPTRAGAHAASAS
ncbi:hypothetical protein OH77DRAFT_1488146 [Trametes cingulata]|nr:hypothetical protein OH77DRAFT_1488146 [Trametes cingulata]